VAKISIGTTTNSTASQYGTQRKIIKTSDGNLFLFANLGSDASTRLRYKKSIDNGVTWDADWTLVYNNADFRSFDIYNDVDNLYLAIAKNSGGTVFIKLTYSGGSYSIGATKTITTSTCIYPTITKRANGDLWVAGYNATATINTFYSTNAGDNWSSGGTIAVTSTLQQNRIMPRGAGLWIIYLTNRLYYVEYTSSWGSPIEISGASSVMGISNRFSVTRISDTDIWIAAVKYNATASLRTIKVWHYTGSWDSGTEISNSGTNEDIEPTISIVGNTPVVVWNENTKANINYRKWNGSSWDSIVTLDSTNVFLPTICEEDDNWLYTYWLSGSASPYTIYFDKVNLNPTQTFDLTSNMHIKAVGLTKDLTSDMVITNSQIKDLTSDMVIKATEQKDLTSDMNIINDRVEFDLTSDMTISAQAIKDLTSDMYLVTSYFANINNKLSFTKRALYDITNKFSFVKRVLSDINNMLVFVKSQIYDIDNDFRMKRQELYDIKNDLRFVHSWQKSATAGFQSLGKTYVKVYITDMVNEVTDVDIDTIKITKMVNGIHTASFELGRAYDAAKPATEATVLIKYHIWTLYKGKIVQISPTDDSESIRIECNNKHWDDNRVNKYFFVGHKPADDKELYYSTIKEALLAQFSWNLNIGTFVPQTMDEFAKGSADILTDLIQNCGNYGWFYDVDETKKLWSAGSGNIINIDRQTLGENVKLYELQAHSFYEDVSEIVNKLRVQMGEMVVSSSSGTGKRTFVSRIIRNYQGFLTEGWREGYDILSRDSTDGYGWDNPDPEDEDEFGKVYRNYKIPYIDRDLGSMKDRYPPYIELYFPGWFHGYSEGRITEGFTIDYENREVIFSQPFVLTTYDYSNNRYDFRAPNLKLFVFKEEYYTPTSSSSDDPESDIGNPMMFFTDKVGDYPTTIIDDLSLTDLNKQEELIYYSNLGVKTVVPPWDDTDFAKDIAYWHLSNSAYKKITGNIDLILDCVCFNNITLQNRIYINGITESAMNIQSMDYDIGSFTVRINLENNHAYKRSVSLPLHR